MAIPKKGSRSIEVDGVRYRWRVRRRPTKRQANHGGPLLLAVSAESGKGATLVVDLFRPHPSNTMLRTGMAVTPAEVAAQVRRARSDGWRPLEAGPQWRREGPLTCTPSTVPQGLKVHDEASLVRVARRERVDVLGFRPAEFGGQDLVINGEALQEHLAAVEPRTGADDHRVSRYLHAGVRPGELFGGPLHDGDLEYHPDDPAGGKVIILVCDCGFDGCGCVVARVVAFEERVVMADFEEPRFGWFYELGPFVFERRAFEEAVGPDAPGALRRYSARQNASVSSSTGK